MVYSIGNLLYTFDTQFLLDMDVYNNINAVGNDIRQPFFAIFSLPFTILPRFISSITFAEIYPFLIAIVQGFIVFVSIILLEKMMKLKGISKLLFIIFMCVTYPTLLFLFNMEQYVIHVFYLIVFIYMSINNIKDKDMLFIMASGTLVTSGIFFPLLGEKNNFKQSIKNIFFTFLKFVAILIISSKVLILMPDHLKLKADIFSDFYGETLSFNDRVNMYTNFALNTVIAPKVEVNNSILATQMMISDDYKYHLVAYNPAINQTNNKEINVFGVIILAMAIVGFILNRKDSFSKICFVWLLFSFVLLPIIGYGADENGFILYSYYFSWAFVCLIFKLFETLFKNHSKIKNVVYTLSIIPIAIINFYGIYQLIEFGIQYFI